MTEYRLPRRLSVVIAALLVVISSTVIGVAVAPSNQDQYPDDTVVSVNPTSKHNGTINSPDDRDQIKTTLDKGEYITVSVYVPEQESNFRIRLDSSSDYSVENVTNAGRDGRYIEDISGGIVATFEIWAEEDDVSVEMALYDYSGDVPYGWELTSALNAPAAAPANPPAGFGNVDTGPIPDPVPDRYSDGEPTRVKPTTTVNGVLNSPEDSDEIEFVLQKGEYVTVSVVVPEEESNFRVRLDSSSDYSVENVTNAGRDGRYIEDISGGIVATFEVWAESTDVISLRMYDYSGDVPYEWYLGLNKNSPRPATVRPSGSNVDINVTVSGSDSTESFREGERITASATSNDADVSDLEVTYKGNSKRLGDDRTASFRLSGTGNQQLEFTYEDVTQTAELEVRARPSEENPDIDGTSLNINPFPVPTGDAPTVSVNATGATDVFVNATVDGQRGSVRMQNVESDRWEADLSDLDSPDMDGLGRGSKVELSVVACNGPCTPDTKTMLQRTQQAFPETELPVDADTAQYANQASQKRPLHYFVFEQVVEIPVILVTFENQNASKFGFGSESAVVEWEEARQYDINSYFGSDLGAMGSIGFDLVYYDNGTEFYRIKSKNHYRNAYTGEVKMAGELTHDAKKAASSDINVADEYLVTHPGTAYGISEARIIDGDSPREQFQISGNKERVYAWMSDNYGVWAHEISHLKLGLIDLYPGSSLISGGIDSGLMSTADQYGSVPPQATLPSPYSVVSRTKYASYRKLSASDNNRPWAAVNEQLLTSQPVSVTAERPSEIQLGDTVEVVNVANGPKYVFEIGDSGDVQAYRLTYSQITGLRSPGLQSLTNVANDGINTGDRDSIGGGAFAEFSVNDRQDTSSAEITVELTASGNSQIVSMNSVTASTTTAFIGVKSPNVTTPDADLRAVDSQGRVTGVTEDGEFVNEIPGAKASGDRIQGPEWISVPSDADVEFEVSTADTQQFVNETNVSAENATISYTTEVTEVGENPQLVTENGTVTVTNTTTTTTNQSAEPGETKEVSTGFSVAEFDRDGDDQIGFDDLRFALREFNNGNLTFDQLRRILQAYNTGASV
jgi:hypothetical protein